MLKARMTTRAARLRAVTLVNTARCTVIALGMLASSPSEAAVYWSEIAAIVAPSDCLRILPGVTLIIDGDALVGRLDVQGSVEFEDLGPRSLEVSEIRVTGEFEVGSETDPFENDAEIRLIAASNCTTERALREIYVVDPSTPPGPLEPGGALPMRRLVMLAPLDTGSFLPLDADDERTVLVLDDGQLRMHGRDPGLTWTRLSTTATGMSMQVPASTGWSPGDRVVLTPTDYEHNHADEVGLQFGPVSFMGAQELWGLDAALVHEHYANRDDEVPVFGEVGKLTRNVKVFSPSPDFVDDAKRDCTDGGYSGAHLEFNGAEIRIERPSGGNANAELAFIEMFNAGKFDRLGHYPIHFHMLGDGTGGRVRGVSVYRSANRGIVIHGSTDIEVTDSVVHDVVGHGFYLEEAPAMPTMRNRLERNLAVQVHGCPPEENESELGDIQLADDARSSGFFFTDPRNALVDNHAGGAFAAGFWWDGGNDFNTSNLCGSRALHSNGIHEEPLDTGLFADTTGYTALTAYAEAELSTTCHGAFVDNVAHSANTGLWAEQHKEQLVRFSGFTAYKNRTRALQLKNRGVTEIYDLRASDNPVTLWPATHAFHLNNRPRVLLVDSVIQGESVHRTASYPFGEATIPFYGVEVYEGRLDVARTVFYGFDDSDPSRGKRAALGRHQAFPFYSNNPDNAIEALTFGPDVNPLYFDDPTTDTRENQSSSTIAGASGFQTVMIRDLSGDITDTPGRWIVANDEFHVPNAAAASEAVYDANTNAWFIDDTVWEQGQLLVEWCAASTTAGELRCEWFDGMAAVPARSWRLVNADGDDFDIIDEVRFVDTEDCLDVGCPDEVDAKHHQPQGNHNLAATNARAPGSYEINFYDNGGVALDVDNSAFDDVRAIQVHWRSAPPVSSINVQVVVPDEPNCVVQYNDMGMSAATTMTKIASGPPISPNEWSYDEQGKVSLILEHGADEQSVLMVFDKLLTCPG